MITIHHLGVSQSDRIVWLMEELSLPYKLKWYNRGADGLAPAEYLALHPAATAPVIQDGDLTLAESAAIVEYICQRHAGGKLSVAPSQPNYPDYLYWMHFNNNILGLFFTKRALQTQAASPEAERIAGLIKRREDGYYRYLEQRLSAVPYLAGPEFTGADIMSIFNLTSLPLFGGRSIEDLPNTKAYVKRIGERPAYIKAMKIAGPTATPPTA
jgi:glutathione S-transferase